MKQLSSLLLLLLLPGLAQLVTAQTTLPNVAPYTGVVGNSSIAGNATKSQNPDSEGKYEISAEGIRLQFVPYGASVSNIFIKDSKGVELDVVFGFDNASYYTTDPLHGHWGAVPGRYANRIKNSSFTIDGTTYHVLPNEHGTGQGSDTLHGGPEGWDHRNWTIVAHTTDSVTFSFADQDGSQGFPGEVVSYVKYTVAPYTWYISMSAFSLTKISPIMLSSHTYWNLDGWKNPNSNTALNHTLYLPYSGQTVKVDGNLIPEGPISNIPAYSVNDWYTAPKQIGANLSSPQLVGNCGTGCTGYDTCYLVNREAMGPYDWREKGPVASLRSDWSGIQVDVFTDQDAFQIYSCNGQNGTTPLKKTQGLDSQPRVLEKYGCVVMEVEDWIDGINYPEWGRNPKQLFGPADPPYQLNAIYKFSVGDQGGNDYGSGSMKRRRA